MRWTKSYLFTLKDNPADAEIPSHQLMVRGGFIRKLAPGIFTYGPMFLKALRKFEAIVREELEKEGAIEVLMPMVQPKELWEESGRWREMGAGLQKFKNRNDHEFCLGATHEEVITDYIRRDVKSYRDLPFNLYQIQNKFRDEIRPRFGLMRGREFVMKDAYSFDVNKEGALKAYEKMFSAYNKIFARLGVDFRVVKADSGNIGGDQSQEFHVLAQSGEDELLVSDQSDYAANKEVCPALNKESQSGATPLDLEKFETPGIKTIDSLAKFLKLSSDKLVKTLFFNKAEPDDAKAFNPVCLLLRGGDEVNEIKLKNLWKLSNPPRMLSDEEVKKVSGASPGSCGPVGLEIPVCMDHALKGQSNLIVGANEDGFHLKNVNIDRDFKASEWADLRFAKEGDPSPDGKGILKSFRGIEVGHIFYLGTKYSEKMKAQYLDESGSLKPIEMGCYGIGMSRTVQAVIEQRHDKDGIIWPTSISPFDLHVCLLDPQNEEALGLVKLIESELDKNGFSVFVDDREERPGVKFKDADLLGFPLRLTIGARGLSQGEVELVDRESKNMTKLGLEGVAEKIIQTIREKRGMN